MKCSALAFSGLGNDFDCSWGAVGVGREADLGSNYRRWEPIPGIEILLS